MTIDIGTATRATYMLRQSFRYDYGEPIRDLSHRLVVIPPERFGDQTRLRHGVTVAAEGASVEHHSDRFGNVIVDVFAPEVASVIEFTAEVSVERAAGRPHRLAAQVLDEGYLLEPTSLTAPDDTILRAANDLAAGADWGVSLAARINEWVHGTLTYRYDVTGVRTAAAEVLNLRAGVCQDYAHLMLALCRACGLPSRYVSGHLLGQGGTHAWVEVILRADDGSGEAIAHPFDPTQGGPCGLGHVTVAVGADYSDVAPTSGTYRGGARGRLTAAKKVALLEAG